MRNLESGRKNLFFHAAWQIIDLKRDVRAYKDRQKKWCRENPSCQWTSKDSLEVIRTIHLSTEMTMWL